MKVKPMFRIKEKASVFATDDKGLRMLVMRPANHVIAQMKIAEGRIAIAHQKDSEFFHRILSESGAHTFVGFLERGTDRVLDASGAAIGRSMPGDSFITMTGDVPAIGTVIDFKG